MFMNHAECEEKQQNAHMDQINQRKQIEDPQVILKGQRLPWLCLIFNEHLIKQQSLCLIQYPSFDQVV